MTLTLPYNNSGKTDIYLFLKQPDLDDVLFDLRVYKNKTRLLNNQVINYSTDDTYALFKISSDLNGGDENNLSLEEGWYNFDLVQDELIHDTGQIYID